jgi:hypothetical protein
MSSRRRPGSIPSLFRKLGKSVDLRLDFALRREDTEID